MNKTALVFSFLLIFLSACKSGDDRPEVSFYFWKTVFKLNETEKVALKKNKVKNLFIRYFDVDLNQNDKKPYPLSPVKFEQQPDSFIIIPVIFIKNRVMVQKKLNVSDLASKILSFIDQINSINKINNNEIQIDCDWSLESRDNFMKFIEIFKKKSKKKLSVTIRLHQVKYFIKTKVPDADYGVLMYYNMGTIAADSLNSVYDREIAVKYIESLKNYPLKLDIALPVFSQGVHIEQKKVVNLISKVNIQNFTNDTNFNQISNNQLHVKHSNIKFGYYFKQSDEIKIESISFDMLKEMADDLKNQFDKKPKQIIFFDLDSINLTNYQDENQDFSKIIDCF
jgi:hypothetical protein